MEGGHLELPPKTWAIRCQKVETHLKWQRGDCDPRTLNRAIDDIKRELAQEALLQSAEQEAAEAES
jgi:hypothetical protein